MVRFGLRSLSCYLAFIDKDFSAVGCQEASSVLGPPVELPLRGVVLRQVQDWFYHSNIGQL